MRLPVLLSLTQMPLLGADDLVSQQAASGTGPIAAAVLVGAVGIWLMVMGRRRWVLCGRAVASLVGLIVLARQLVPPGDTVATLGFWLPAALTIVAAVATITSKNPVYSAVWFAVTLLGTAGLILLQGAQFIGMATIVVYAGAIVVTFLFVLMLAQPGGQARYDRISWGWFPSALAAVAGATLIGSVVAGASNFRDGQRDELEVRLLPVLSDFVGEQNRRLIEDKHLRRATVSRLPDGGEALKIELAWDTRDPEAILSRSDELRQRIAVDVLEVPPSSIRLDIDFADVLDRHHVARLGGRLFTQYLVAVEVAGTLLMLALVGAVAIVIQGRGAVKDGNTSNE